MSDQIDALVSDPRYAAKVAEGLVRLEELSGRRGPFGRMRVSIDPVAAVDVLHASMGAWWLALKYGLRPCAPHSLPLLKFAGAHPGGLSSAGVTSSDAARAHGVTSSSAALATSAAVIYFPCGSPESCANLCRGLCV